MGSTSSAPTRRSRAAAASAKQAFLDGRSKGDSAFDDRGFPLTLRPLVWEPYTPPAVGKKKVQTTSGSYCAISPEALLHKVCIMPDFKRDPAAPLPGQPRSSDEVDSQRHFLINDLVHTVSEEFICTAGGDDSAPALPPAAVGNAEPPSAAPRSSGYRDMQRQRGINELMCSQPAEVKAFWGEWFGCEAARLRAAIGAAPL
ncbi:hypothetical protein OEZ86_011949 [Tetradesmus obliquus]|nr:hypothetical protein OEZ86_011949 [Tetradesmus obliquus]